MTHPTATREHALVVSYEYDRDAPTLRKRVTVCAADGLPWPCPQEIARAILASLERAR